MHGQAELMSNKGVWYLGQFLNSAKEGQGEMRFYDPHPSKGDLYKGAFVKNMREGYGTYYFAKNELTYVGNWKANKKHGQGKLVHKDGIVKAEGMFDDKLHGPGMFYNREKDIKLEGNFT